MSRTIGSAWVVGLALGLVGTLGGTNALGQSPTVEPPDGPALAQPNDATPVAPSPFAPASPDRGPILAVPGIVRPRASVARSAETPPPLGDLPALTAPAEMTPRPLPRQLSGRASTVPLTLESDTSEPDLTRPKSKSGTTPPPTTNRRPGILGRMMGSGSSPNRGVAAESDDEIEIETHADPAQVAAVKRRIERQAFDAVGDRARQVEVRLKGKEVHIRVSGTKLFQKRAVRSALERLPTSNGYRTIIDAID